MSEAFALLHRPAQKRRAEVSPVPKKLVKVSGDLIQRVEVYRQLRAESRTSELSICAGGGAQINEAFAKAGHVIAFGPFDRVCQSEEQRRLARTVLLENAQIVRDNLSTECIHAKVFAPFLDETVGGTLCNVNGDWMPIILYDGFDEIEIYTLEKNLEKKRAFYRGVWGLCGGAGDPPKISVTGFR